MVIQWDLVVDYGPDFLDLWQRQFGVLQDSRKRCLVGSMFENRVLLVVKFGV